MPAPETYYDVAMRRLDEQIDRIGSLGAATALVPIFGALIAAFNKDVRGASIALYGVAFVLYLAMIGTVVGATRIGEWSLRPDLETLHDYATGQDEQTVRNWVAEECRRSIVLNEPKLRQKALFVDVSLGALVLVAVTLSAAALLEFLS